MNKNFVILVLSFFAIFFSLFSFVFVAKKFKRVEEINVDLDYQPNKDETFQAYNQTEIDYNTIDEISIKNDIKDGEINTQDFSKEEDINLTNIPTKQPYDKPINIEYIVKGGDTIEKILSELKIEKNFAVNFIMAVKKMKKDILLIKQDQVLNFEISHIGYNPKIKRIENSIIGPKKSEVDEKFEILSFSTKTDSQKYLFFKTSDYGFSFSIEEIEVVKKTKIITGEITSSLFFDATKMGIPSDIVMKLIDMYSFDIDFQRDIRYGDSFTVAFDEFYDTSGNQVKSGNIIYSSLNIKSEKNYEYFYFAKFKDFFDANGKSFKKGLLKTPINGARLSSSFGYRKHPVLGYTKLHKGVDFAAQKGTPIFAAANGRIEFRGRKGTYGNYIKIRHNDNYSTAYAHMSRFGNQKLGSFVKQGDVIGYVGTTGRSTGNHLHYEIIKNGIQVNPHSIKSKPNKILRGKDSVEFKDQMQAFKTSIQNI